VDLEAENIEDLLAKIHGRELADFKGNPLKTKGAAIERFEMTRRQELLAAVSDPNIAMMLMTLSVQYGVTHMPVQRSAVILLFELVVAALAAQMLTSEVVSSVEWAGGLCIIAASLIAARQQAEGQT